MERELSEKETLLHGIRILDLADEKGAFCSKVLSDLGAFVIKVEKPDGDNARKIGPFFKNVPFPEASISFYYNNTNKRAITLDIEKDEGRELFCRLVKTVDVVVETFPAGYLENLGCHFNELSRINPVLIMVSVTGFGQIGARSSYKSCDLVTSAFGGQMFISGSPSTTPLRPYGEQSFYSTSLFAAVGVLLAIFKRRKTAKGEHIDISSQETAVATLDHVLVHYFYDGIISKRQGNLSWNRSSFILPCKDGHIHISILTQWEALVEWVEAEGMAEDLVDEIWKDEGYRNQNIDHIMDVLQKWTRSHSVGELFELAQAMRLPWAPVSPLEDVFCSAQLKERQFFTAVDHPQSGQMLECPGMPYKFNGFSLGCMRHAPLLGEDNERVYHDELGLSHEEIKRLESQKVI